MTVEGSYSGDPASSTLDAVRCMLGDIGPIFILSDAEIAYFDSVCAPIFNDPLMTAAVCADILAGRYAGEVSISADGVSISTDQLQLKYTQLAAALRATYKILAAPGGYPYVGGIDSFRVVDPSVRPTNFGIGMDDNYRAGAQGRADAPEDWYYAQFDSEPW